MTASNMAVAGLLVRHGEVRRLFLRELRIMARIGVYAHEQAAPQPLLVDVDLWVAPPVQPLQDDLANVLDYDFVRSGVAKLVAQRHWNLQESLCHAILDLCLAPPQVLAARVSTAKTDIYPDSQAVGYEVTRIKPDAG